MSKFILSVFVFAFLFSCQEESLIPKPPTNLRVDLPKHQYKKFDNNLPYSFDIPLIYDPKVMEENNLMIKMGMLSNIKTKTSTKSASSKNKDWTMKMSYKKINNKDTISLNDLINHCHTRVDYHKIKATGINSHSIKKSDKSVYGTFFELQGDVAVPFQFYFTDSLNTIVFAEVTLGCQPNWSKMQGKLMYVKKDILRIFNSFEWSEQ